MIFIKSITRFSIAQLLSLLRKWVPRADVGLQQWRLKCVVLVLGMVYWTPSLYPMFSLALVELCLWIILNMDYTELFFLNQLLMILYIY